MTRIAQSHEFVIGVDTHAASHVYTIINNLGAIVDTQKFATTTAGITRAITWAMRRTGGDMDALWVVEGTSSYGAILTGTLISQCFRVAEPPFIAPAHHGGKGKDDEVDSGRIARSVLSLDEKDLRIPRTGDGLRACLQILVTAREELTHERTRTVNALTALMRRFDLGVDARKPLSDHQIVQISRWRGRHEEIALATARTQAIRLARKIHVCNKQIDENLKEITSLVKASPAAPLLEERGYGPIGVATCMAAWSHAGRIQSEAHFASLAGVSPIPASSGNTVRHRLNRGGDRRLNQAIHMITMSRMNYDPDTKAYVERRRSEGKTNREIRRILKRYIARHIYRTLNHNAQNEAPIMT